MTLQKITISAILVALLGISLYLLIALPLLRDSTTEVKLPIATDTGLQESNLAAKITTLAGEHSNIEPLSETTAVTRSRFIEIFGRIIDSAGRPIEDVLVTEERYFFSATSDHHGNYHILLDLPPNRKPTLNFLRSGYEGFRTTLTQAQLQQPIFQLDTTLTDSAKTLRIQGRVANQTGIGLDAVRIEISALNTSEENNYYLTVFSDERGNFTLEGVRAETHYRLSAFLAPEYSFYSNDDFFIGSDTRQVQIELRSLHFVNLGGMILNPDSAPVANFEIYINNLSTGTHSRKIVSDSSGFFTLDQFPLGRVNLSTRGAEFFKISGLELTDLEHDNLVLIVDKGDHYLSGWVSDENGIAIKKAMVTLDTTINNEDVEYSSYRSQSTDSNGRFSFERVAGGEHRLSIYANGFNKLERIQFLKQQSQDLLLTLTRP